MQIAQVFFLSLFPCFLFFFLHGRLTEISEPLLFRLTIEVEDGDEIVLYGLFEPRAILPPRGGTCESFYDTNEGVGSDDSVIMSGLSFFVVRCGGWMFSDGDMSIVGQRVYYQSSDGPQYPRNQTCLLSFSFFPFFFRFSFFLFFSLFLVTHLFIFVCFGSVWSTPIHSSMWISDDYFGGDGVGRQR